MTPNQPRRGRERVLHEAQALFLTRGYTETSMQQIADASGLTKAALYYHFEDKEDLLAEVMIVEMQRVRQGLQHVIGDDDAFGARLAAIARHMFALFEGDLGRLMEAFEAYVPLDRREGIARRAPLPHTFLRPIFEQAVANDEMRPDVHIDLAVSLFLSMILGQMKMPINAQLSLPPPDEGGRDHRRTHDLGRRPPGPAARPRGRQGRGRRLTGRNATHRGPPAPAA